MSDTLTYAGLDVRDHRLNTILSYHGTSKDLNEKGKANSLVCSGRYYGQCANCPESCAETRAILIRDAVAISHAPLGCASLSSGRNVNFRAVCRSRGFDVRNIRHISTNMLEKDTVYGGADKLRFAIREAERRYHPKAVFVLSSCAAGIIGEDLESISDEMEEELGYPVIPVPCEGFKSTVWATGFDLSYHAILWKLVKPPRKKQEDLVNVFSFAQSDGFGPLLRPLGLKANYLVDLSTVEGVTYMSEAVCSVQMCTSLSMYIAHVLEEKYGVPEIKVPSPFGLEWTDQWVRTVAALTHREAQAEAFIASEHARIAAEIAELKEFLQGKTVYVWGGDAWAMNIINIVRDFGMQLIGFNLNHHDVRMDSNPEEVLLDHFINVNGNVENTSICNKQPFIVHKILKAVKPDVVVLRHGGDPVVCAKAGVPTLYEGDVNWGIGYEGILHLGRRLKAVFKKKRFFEHVGKHIKLPYTEWWLNEADPFYFEGASTK
jgi:nitrogenase molybdenum-iron protein alpha chain